MKTLHMDCGRAMQGGQWQALYLIERLMHTGHGNETRLFAPTDSRLFKEAGKRG